MLTPQEVSERAFPKASFGGYNMTQVDEFLDSLTADYTALYNENAVLKNKMKVLVDKVEEYRTTEDAMRKALMTAQRMADDMIQEAEQKKADIMRQAEAEARDRAAQLHADVEAEEFRLTSAQNATAAYVQKVRALHQKQLEYLDALNDLAPEVKAPEVDPVDATISEIDDNVQRLLAQAMADASAENQKAKQPQEEAAAPTTKFPAQEEPPQKEKEEDFSGTRRIDFSNLQFGRDYEIK